MSRTATTPSNALEQVARAEQADAT